MLMELSRLNKSQDLLGFLDYEKAFDFISRGNILKDLVHNGAGIGFTKAVADMYEMCYYTPKLSLIKYGDKISYKHGVTQGRTSSTSFFNFEMKDMPLALHSRENDFLKYNLFQ